MIGVTRPEARNGMRDADVTVIEFLGLPGAGKTTVANAIAHLLKTDSVPVCVTLDYVVWLGSRSKLDKVYALGNNFSSFLKRLALAIAFGLSIRPLTALSIRRLLLVPLTACYVDNYKKQNRVPLLVLDQAGAQMIWSLGAYADSYSQRLLDKLVTSVIDTSSTIFVYIEINPNISAKRISQRNTNQSRFDFESVSSIERKLTAATPLCEGIVNSLESNRAIIIRLDALESVCKKSTAIKNAIAPAV